jgi:dihydrofolate reductase
LGSGSIVQQFANLGLIDEYQLVIVPIILGAGKSLFKDVKKMNMKLLGADKHPVYNIHLPAVLIVTSK